MKKETIVHRVRIGKADLSAIPDDERNLLFMLGNMSNELSILHKLQWYANNYKYPSVPNINGNAHISQALFISKLLLGKSKEAWEFIVSIFLSTPLGKIYCPLISERGKQNLELLKKYFGKGTFIDTIRNEFVFHYLTKGWSDRLTDAFKKVDENVGECQFYVADKTCNTHWWGAEVVINYAMLETIQADEPTESMDKFMREILEVGLWLTEFLNDCIIAILDKHLDTSKNPGGYGDDLIRWRQCLFGGANGRSARFFRS